jgi:hypothetical protein
MIETRAGVTTTVENKNMKAISNNHSVVLRGVFKATFRTLGITAYQSKCSTVLYSNSVAVY